jgi:thiaminase
MTARVHETAQTPLSSSRLDRSRPITPALLLREREVTSQMIDHCERSFDRSSFFRALAAARLEDAAIRYGFAQYRFFRDQLHRWFARCISMAPSCAEPGQKAAIMELADHIFTDLRDDHERMYDDFLCELGLAATELARATPSLATQSYIRSFLDDHGEQDEFFISVAALGARELCVSLRNQRLIRQYFSVRGHAAPTWISLHAELELAHFHDAIRPALTAYEPGSPRLDTMQEQMARAIDRHVGYFDALLSEQMCNEGNLCASDGR